MVYKIYYVDNIDNRLSARTVDRRRSDVCRELSWRAGSAEQVRFLS